MTATIIQSNNQALQSVEVDGVTVDFGANPIRGRLPWGRAYKCEHAAIASLGGLVALRSHRHRITT